LLLGEAKGELAGAGVDLVFAYILPIGGVHEGFGKEDNRGKSIIMRID
jgi:hypothetical protein